MSKPIICINYEVHSDREPTEIIGRLVPFLKKVGFGTYVVEDPKDWSIENARATLREAIDGYGAEKVKLLSIKTHMESNPDLTQVAIPYMRLGGVVYVKMTQADIVKKISMIDGHVTTRAAQLQVLSDMEMQGIKYLPMDLREKEREVFDSKKIPPKQAIAIRDAHMVSIIENACKIDPSHKEILVGAIHNGIESALRAKGYPVISIYIMNHDILDTDPYLPAGREDNDSKIQNADKAYISEHYPNTTIINLRTHPELDPVAIATKLLFDALGISDVGEASATSQPLPHSDILGQIEAPVSAAAGGDQ